MEDQQEKNELKIKILDLERELETALLKIERICNWVKVNHGIIIPDEVLGNSYADLHKQEINELTITNANNWPCIDEDEPLSDFQNTDWMDMDLDNNLENEDFKQKITISTSSSRNQSTISSICKPCLVVLPRIEIKEYNNLTKGDLEEQDKFLDDKLFNKKRIVRSLKKIKPSEIERLKALDICCTDFLNKCQLFEEIRCPISTCPRTFQVTQQDKSYVVRDALKVHLKRIHYFRKDELYFNKKPIIRSLKKIKPSETERLKALEICCSNFLNKCQLFEEIKCPISTCPRSFQVTDLDKIHVLREALKIHLRRIHYFSKNELKSQRVKVRGFYKIKSDKSSSYSNLCQICGKIYKSKNLLSEHIKNFHEGLRKKSPGYGKHQCTTCKKKLVTESALKIHIKETHLKEKNFLCWICSNSFARNDTLQRHMRTHTGEKPYKCEICQKSFTNNASYYGHRETHYEGQKREMTKKYSCDLCPVKFRHNAQLQRHIEAVHDNVRRYKCTEPNCDKRFKTRNNLKYHINSHSNPNRKNRGYNKPKI